MAVGGPLGETAVSLVVRAGRLARTNEIVHAEITRAVDDANKAVSKAESIRKFTVLAGDFTEDNGYLTPSLKLKRNMVMKDYASEVEMLYAGPKE